VSCVRRCSQARRNGGRAVGLQGAAQQHAKGRPASMAKSCAEKADAALPGCSRPQGGAPSGRENQGSVPAARAARRLRSVPAPALPRSKRCKRAFQRGPRMARRGWPSVSGAHRHFHRQIAEQGRPGAWFDGARDLPPPSFERRDQVRRRLAIVIGPENAVVFLVAGQRFGGGR